MYLEQLHDFPTTIAIDGAINKNGIAVLDKGTITTSVLIPPNTLTRAEKLEYIFTEFNALIAQYNPTYIIIEGYSFNSIGRTFSIAEIGGVFRLVATINKILLLEVPPTTMKKYITGNGRADKVMVADAIHTFFGISFSSYDESDAFALLMCGVDYFTTNISYIKELNDDLVASCELLVGQHPNMDKNTKYLLKNAKQRKKLIKRKS